MTALPPDGFDRRDDPRVIRRHDHGSDIRLDRATPDLDDHRLAANVDERLAGQAGRSHARGNEDDRVSHVREEAGGKPGLYVLPTSAQSG